MNTMTWMMLDETGNAIGAYDDDVSAHVALRSLAEAEPDAADRVLLVQYDDAGHPVGDAVTIEDLPVATFNVVTASDILAVFLIRSTTGVSTVRQSVVDARSFHVATPRTVAAA